MGKRNRPSGMSMGGGGGKVYIGDINMQMSYVNQVQV